MMVRWCRLVGMARTQPAAGPCRCVWRVSSVGLGLMVVSAAVRVAVVAGVAVDTVAAWAVARAGAVSAGVGAA